jgi:hypothetical protein
MPIYVLKKSSFIQKYTGSTEVQGHTGLVTGVF